MKQKWDTVEEYISDASDDLGSEGGDDLIYSFDECYSNAVFDLKRFCYERGLPFLNINPLKPVFE